MPRIKIVKTPKRLPKAEFGIPASGMSGLVDMFNREDQKVAGLQNSGMFNLFDTKWGVQPQGTQQMPEIAPSIYQTQPLVNPANNKGILDTSKLVSSSTPASTKQTQPKQKSLFDNFAKVTNTLGTGLGVLSAGANYLENRQRQKDINRWLLQSGNPANYYAVDTTKDIGDYDQYGNFKPNITGFKSKGMFANAYYPQQGFAEEGGELPEAQDGMTLATDYSVHPAFIPSMRQPTVIPYAPSNNTVPVVPTSNNTHTASFSNNPLNLHYGKFAQKYNGIPGMNDLGGKVAIFPDLKTGLKANIDLLFGPNYANLTISEARKKWVGYDNPSIKAIVNEMGGDRVINNLSLPEKDRLFKLFAKWESKKGYNAIKNINIFDPNVTSSPEATISQVTNPKNMKVRITGTPDENQQMALGGEPKYSGQSSYGLYIGQRNLYKTMAKYPYEDYGNSVSEKEETQEDPYVLEAEGGETILRPDGTHMNINGPSHAEGGVKMTQDQAPEDSFIFSKTRKMKKITGDMAKFFGKNPDKKHTPAEVAKQYDTNKWLAILADPNTDKLAKKTAELMLKNYENKLAHLGLVQEGMKGFPQGIPEISKKLVNKMQGENSGEEEKSEQGTMQAKYGGGLKKFQGDTSGSTVGVPYANAPAYTGGVNSSDIGGIGSMASTAASRKYALPNWWEHWTKANTPAGAKSPAHGYSSLYDPKAGNPSYDDYEYWRDRYGKDFEGATDADKRRNFQKYMFGELQKGNPEAYKHIMDYWGQTKAGTLNDAIFGARTAYGAGSRIPPSGGGDNPPGTSGTPPPGTTGGGNDGGTPPPSIQTPPPIETTPSGNKIPFAPLQQDINNRLGAALNLALLKKYHMQSRTIQPTLPEFIPQDWRGYAATMSGNAAKQAELLGTFQPGQSQGAAGSAIQGQLAENLGKYIGQIGAENAAGASKTSAERANILNQFTQYNAGKRDYDMDYENTADARYKGALGHGLDRAIAAQNALITNRAGMYATNLTTSPEYYFDPRLQKLKFNSPRAYQDFMNRMRGGYQDMDRTSQIAIYNDAYDRAKGTPDQKHAAALEAMKLQGSMGRTTSTMYPGSPARNKISTTTPNMASAYGNMAYPQMGGYGYDYASSFPMGY